MTDQRRPGGADPSDERRHPFVPWPEAPRALLVPPTRRSARRRRPSTHRAARARWVVIVLACLLVALAVVAAVWSIASAVVGVGALAIGAVLGVRVDRRRRAALPEGRRAQPAALAAPADGERIRLDRENTELRASSQRLVRAELQARQDLELRLHDGALARLFEAMAQIGRARARTDDEAVLEPVTASAVAIRGAVEDLRTMIADQVLPPTLREAGLAEAVRLAARELGSRVEVIDEGAHDRKGTEAEIVVYFTVMALLRSATRAEGGASAVVRFRAAEGELRARIDSEGVVRRPLPQLDGDRLRAIGGDLLVVEGRSVVIQVPMQE